MAHIRADFDGTANARFVAPVSGIAMFSERVHLPRPRLHFYRVFIVNQDRRVERAIAMGLGGADVIVIRGLYKPKPPMDLCDQLVAMQIPEDDDSNAQDVQNLLVPQASPAHLDDD